MIVAIIPAKGGSRRLPNKNMAPINGRPMIDYSIQAARGSRRIDRLYVSTDSDEIAAHAQAEGVAVIRRPTSLGGDVPLAEVLSHALENMPQGDEVSVLVCLQPDHPDREIGVDEVLDIFLREQADRLTCTDARGTKNGAHYVLSRHFLITGESRKDTVIVDDCTNIHYEAELEIAAERLAARGSSEARGSS